MKAPRLIVALAATTALVAVPASAAAEPKVKHVRSAVKQMKGSLADARQAALAGHSAELRVAITELGSDARRAERKARKIKRNASSRRQRVQAARALTLATAGYDQLIGRFAAILDSVPADVQHLIAGGIALGADAQQRLVGMLARLADRLPEGAAARVLAAIERFETDGDLAALVDALGSDGVTDAVKSALTERLDEMFSHLETVVDRLAELDPELAEMVTGVLDSVSELVDRLSEIAAGFDLGDLGLGGLGFFKR